MATFTEGAQWRRECIWGVKRLRVRLGSENAQIDTRGREGQKRPFPYPFRRYWVLTPWDGK